MTLAKVQPQHEDRVHPTVSIFVGVRKESFSKCSFSASVSLVEVLPSPGR